MVTARSASSVRIEASQLAIGPRSPRRLLGRVVEADPGPPRPHFHPPDKPLEMLGHGWIIGLPPARGARVQRHGPDLRSGDAGRDWRLTPPLRKTHAWCVVRPVAPTRRVVRGISPLSLHEGRFPSALAAQTYDGRVKQRTPAYWPTRIMLTVGLIVTAVVIARLVR